MRSNAQTIIGGDTVDQSAILDIQDTAKGVLVTRLTMAQRNAIVKPAFGLLILNTTRKCLEMNIGNPDVPDWKCLTMGIPALSDADSLNWNKKLDPSDTLSLSNRIDAKLGLPPSGNNPGNILYWNGSSWVQLTPGLPGQALILSQEGLPVWAGAAYATVTTNAVVSVTPTSANVGGNISADGGANVSARGIVWSTTTNPTLSSSVLNLGSGTGAFSGTLSGLSPNTLYYIRAFATNSAGTAYGNQESFSTLAATVPVLSTNSVASITQTTALSGGNITSDGGAPVTQRGVVYATTQNPTLANAFTEDGSGSGNFTSTLSGLTPNTTYYVRAYATNSIGTAYGNELSFIFNPPVYTCGANVAPGVWKQFMCHNLGAANPAADPFTPSWEINGGYWQWGRKDMAAPGPSGPGINEANEGVIAGWNTNNAPDGSWSDAVKSSNDPCPTGYRVPTWAQWQGLIANNLVANVGSSWTEIATNYSTGKRFGDALVLPVPGGRNGEGNGVLYARGSSGYYWSSSEIGSDRAWILDVNPSGAVTYNSHRPYGYSIRCIAE